MRYVVLDTETTGLEWRQGHKIIEIGCVEMMGRQVGSRHFHEYVHPEREIDPGAQAVHGISLAQLEGKPVFGQVADAFLEFIQGSTLIIHNASFDLGFLDYELGLIKKGRVTDYVHQVIDSLAMAREMFPGKRNNLDALCERLGVNNAHRQLHGALLDSEILGEVYLAMTRGQDSLTIETAGTHTQSAEAQVSLRNLVLPEPQPSEPELAAHHAYLRELQQESKGKCIWLNKEAT
ncbi:MAG: DNA polymerase III subunit epsilon [Limnobacter sp.]|nr:DNA polymerase III subunit epsilon [Limnobacter sp.]